MKKGLVIKSTGSWYDVIDDSSKQLVNCRIKGKFRIKGIKTTNPIAVGDKVEYTLEEDGTGTIKAIDDRKNYIIRKSINLSKQSHIIAANIDRAFLLVTINYPQTSTGFIDRFLVTAEAYHIPTTIIFNKVDLLNDAEKETLEQLKAMYTNIGYECHTIKATEKDSVAFMEGMMKNKVSLLSGHSGVGKSTLVNSLENLELRTGDISDFHFKGKHTTTFAEMIPLKAGGYIVDTPGIKGFGLIDIPKEEISHYFIEMREALQQCKFNNCVHINEPNCAVKQGVANGEIHEERYKNYTNIYNNDEDQNYR